MFERGFWTIGRPRGVAVRLHWTIPIGILVFTGFRFAPIAWGAFLALILAHEVGHALIAMRYRQRVLSIDLTGFGGLCRWSGYPTDYQRGVIAWGGVMAQAVLYGLTFLLVAILGPIGSPLLADLAAVFLGTNLWLMAVNLMPIPPLDGAEAWRVVPEAYARTKARLSGWRASRPAAHPKAPPARKGDYAEVANAFQQIAEDAKRARRSR